MKTADNHSTINELWQSMPGSAMPARPALDLTRRRRRERRILWAETLVLLSGLTIALALLIQGSTTLGVVTLLYSLLGAVLGLRTRRANIAALDLSLADQLAATGDRLRARRNHELGAAVIWLAALGYFLAVKLLKGGSLDLLAQLLILALGLAVVGQTARAVKAWRASAGSDKLDILKN